MKPCLKRTLIPGQSGHLEQTEEISCRNYRLVFLGNGDASCDTDGRADGSRPSWKNELKIKKVKYIQKNETKRKRLKGGND
jgi:hypothetical protein